MSDIDAKLADVAKLIQLALGSDVSCSEIARIGMIARANPDLADSLLTEAIRQWGHVAAENHAARPRARCG
jgi:hypothetical protein